MKDLVQQEVLSAEQKEWLVAHVSGGGSVVVAAEASRSGKSTLANALLEAIPPDMERIYIRGTYEPFDWLDKASPDRVTLLVNEFSPHLPVYPWGESAKRVLELAEQGYQVVASMHGERPEQIAAQLMGDPINATAAQVVALDVLVFRNADLALGHRFNSVSSIWRLEMSDEPNTICYERIEF